MSTSAQRPTGPFAPPEPTATLDVTSADGSTLYVEVHGPEDAPAVLLSHGWTCSTAFWAAVVRDLVPEHRVILYDQRGHGHSPAAKRGGYSTRALADDLVAVLDATLAPGERAVLAGHSMGGMTLMAAADRAELHERAAAVLLCSTGAVRLLEESVVVPLRPGWLRTSVHRAILGSSLPLGPVTPLSRRLLKYGTMSPGATSAMVEACARVVHACPRAVRAGWARHVLAGMDVEARVARLTVPTAVIVGTADRLTPPVHARAIAAALPHCVGLTELPGRGHMTPLEDAEAVTGVIRTLVAEHLTEQTEQETTA